VRLFKAFVYLSCVWKRIRERKQIESASESGLASLYCVKVIQMSQLAIDSLLFYYCFTGCFVVAKQTMKQTAHWERKTPICLKLTAFLTAPSCSHDGVWNSVPASDQNHANIPINNGWASYPDFYSSTLLSYYTDPLSLSPFGAVEARNYKK